MFASFQSVQLVLGDVTLLSELTHPPHATGVVVFSHGSGSSRLSSRNRAVTQLLQAAGLATLLFDLLSPAENQTYATRFDIVLLTRRLLGVAHWMTQQPTLAGLRVGFSGPAPRPLRRLARRPNWAVRLGPSFRAAVGPTWPCPCCTGCGPLPCCSWAATTARSLPSTSRPCGYLARPASCASFRVPVTCSRSPAP